LWPTILTACCRRYERRLRRSVVGRLGPRDALDCSLAEARRILGDLLLRAAAISAPTKHEVWRKKGRAVKTAPYSLGADARIRGLMRT